MGRVEKYNFFFSIFRSVSLKHTVLKAKKQMVTLVERGHIIIEKKLKGIKTWDSKERTGITVGIWLSFCRSSAVNMNTSSTFSYEALHSRWRLIVFFRFSMFISISAYLFYQLLREMLTSLVIFVDGCMSPFHYVSFVPWILLLIYTSTGLPYLFEELIAFPL